jgi:hypothetical protein
MENDEFILNELVKKVNVRVHRNRTPDPTLENEGWYNLRG